MNASVNQMDWFCYSNTVMKEILQAYDETGAPISGKGYEKLFAQTEGLLHGASHTWIWRRATKTIETLVQKRSPEKSTWPDRYDLSAGGHMQLGESPEAAAVREVHEELGLSITIQDIKLFATNRANIVAENGLIENEIQFLYSLEINGTTSFKLQEEEVASISWVTLSDLRALIEDGSFVPHSSGYFGKLFAELESHIS